MNGRHSAGSDVLVVGAGLPGLALAIALRGTGLSVRLVDRHRPAIDTGPEWDARIYAISPGNARFLHAIGIWSRLDPERITAVETMRVFGDRSGAQIDFSAFDAGERALAWIVEQRALMAATLEQWADAERPEPIETESGLATLARERDRIVLETAAGERLSARVVVGADGVRSWVREQANIRAAERSYGQTAVVANFATEKPHRGRAWQWFQPDGGVLAWLPLPGRRISIVWSAPQPRADALLSADDGGFVDAVSAAGAGTLGNLALLSPRASFPLSYMRPASAIAERVVLIGDAAHGIHPLAGQGLNLGYGDVAALARTLAQRGAIDDAGFAPLLARFAGIRALPNLTMQAATDGLWRLFGAGHPAIATVRNRGLAVLNRLPVIKAILMQPAMR